MTHPYTLHLNPGLGEILTALGLDVSYERAEGSTLYWRDAQGSEHAVLDLTSGDGALLLGHNHPKLVAAAQALLSAGVPVFAPLSLRRRAGELAAQLAAAAARETGGQCEFMALLANGGDEALALALRHAELERVHALRELLDGIAINVQAARDAVRRGQARLPAQLLDAAWLRGKSFALGDAQDWLTALLDHNARELARRAAVLALEGSHAHLAGAARLVSSGRLRRPFEHLGLNMRFVPVGDTQALERIAAEHALELHDVAVQDGLVVLKTHRAPAFTAFLVEPIQCDGGMRELDAGFAAEIRRFCNARHVPLVVDEAASGLGRCGSLFASTHAGFKGDYYVLSSALGGGLCRLGALLVRRERYRADIGLLREGLLAEDELGAGIAQQMLGLLQADDGALMRRGAELGQSLRERLQALCARFPDVLAGVRGRGLMLGLEIAPQSGAASHIFRDADRLDSLGYLLAGYLLRVAGLRVAPAADATRVLCLQPSLLTTEAELDRIEAALHTMCLVLQRQDALHVVFPRTDPARPMPRQDIRDCRENAWTPAPLQATPTRAVRKVAFVTHFVNQEWVRASDPMLAELTDEELGNYLRNLGTLRKCAPSQPVRIHSPLGPAVDLVLYPLSVMSEQMEQWLASGDFDAIRADIDAQLRIARDDGCELAGLGMYISSLTNNCTAVKTPGIGLTAGTALTVSLSLQALQQAVDERGLDWRTLTPAVVGASGATAAVYGSLLAEQAGQLLLIGAGRDNSMGRLRATQFAIYEECWQMLLAGRGQAGAGIAARLAHEPLIAQWLDAGAPQRHRGRLIHEALVERHGQDPFIRISQDPRDVRQAHVALCRAGSDRPFLHADDFRHGAVVCDVSVPTNVHEEGLARRPDLLFMRGGIVSTPNGESLPPTSRLFLQEGQIFACMAETAILGLAGMSGHYSYGDISRRQVREIGLLAAAHGFGMAGIKRLSSL